MGVFDYKGYEKERVKELISDVATISQIAINSYWTDNYKFIPNDGWRVLNGSNIGYDGKQNKYGAFYGEGCFPEQSSECNILGKFDDEGKLIGIGISFWGTGTYQGDARAGDMPYLYNNIGDYITDLKGFISSGYAVNYAKEAFYELLSAVAIFAKENGLTGEQITITGHSLGGWAVNSMAELSNLGEWDGFFANAEYIAWASPTEFTGDPSVLNIGYANDPVFTSLNENLDSKFHNTFNKQHIEIETGTNNIYSFNDYSAKNSNVSILNLKTWANHSGLDYASGIERIIDSKFYDYTDRNSTIIVSNLSDTTRDNTWVKDIREESNGDTVFYMGSYNDDLIQGGSGNDYLDGAGSGNDVFEDDNGFNVIYGGSGKDVYSISRGYDNTFITKSPDGSVYFKFDNGDITKTTYLDKVSFDYSVEGISTYFDLDELNEMKTFYATADNEYKVVGKSEQKTVQFAGSEDSTLISLNEDTLLFSGPKNDSIYGSGKGDTFYFDKDFGDDVVYNATKLDKFVFREQAIGSEFDFRNYLSQNDQGDAVFQLNDYGSVTFVGCKVEDLNDFLFIV